MKNIISFSLFGTDKLYYAGALQNLRRQAEIYPGWVCRFYVDKNIPESLINELRAGGAEVVFGSDILPLEDRHFVKTIWRFLPALDPDVSIFIARDTDSRLGWREQAAVKEWLSSGKGFHIMRDNPQHTKRMMAGMWGCRSECLKHVNVLIAGHSFTDAFGNDQRFLEECIYPLAIQDCLVHTSGVKYAGETIREFPLHPSDPVIRYVGAQIGADERPLIETLEQRKLRSINGKRYLKFTG